MHSRSWPGRAGTGRLVGGGGRMGWEGHLPNIAEQRTEDSELGGDLHRGPHFLKQCRRWLTVHC